MFKAAFSAATLGALLGFGAIAHADEPATEQPARINAEGAKVDVETTKPEGRKGEGASRRTTELTGLSVYNKKSEKLGTLNDVVVDLTHGKVTYGALSRGGVLGIGDKLFAIPWNAMKHGEFVKDGEKHEFIRLDAQPETLENAPGFNQDKWPDFASAKYTDSIDEHFRNKAKEEAVETEAENEAANEEASSASKANDHVHRSANVLGMTVENQTRKKLGSIKDLVVDVDTGEIRYAVLSFGGIAGFGDKMFAIPWKAMKCEYSGEEESHYLVLNVKYETLKKATGFDKDNWPDFGNAEFLSENDRQFQETDEK